MRIDLDGRGEPSVVGDGKGAQVPIDVNHAGDQLLVNSSGGFWLIPTDGSGEPREVEDLRSAGMSMRFPPDDQWIAYWSRESGAPQVVLHELGGANRTIQVSVDGGEDPVWAPRGRKLYFTKNEEQVWEVDLSTEEQLESPSPRILFESSRRIGNIEVSADGERFLARCTSRETSPAHVLLRGRPRPEAS